jgi:hypothetical protein
MKKIILSLFLSLLAFSMVFMAWKIRDKVNEKTDQAT